MAKTKEAKKPMSGFDREEFTRKGLQQIASMQAGVLKARENLRNKTGALKEMTADFHQGLADGCQLELRFKTEDEDDDEPEDLSVEGEG
jgi:hypothetical protein